MPPEPTQEEYNNALAEATQELQAFSLPFNVLTRQCSADVKHVQRTHLREAPLDVCKCS